MVSTNNEIRNAPINGPIKERIMSMSNFLIKALRILLKKITFDTKQAQGKWKPRHLVCETVLSLGIPKVDFDP